MQGSIILQQFRSIADNCSRETLSTLIKAILMFPLEALALPPSFN
jgi:hypothetical protein